MFKSWGWEVAELAGAFGSAVGNTAPVRVLPPLDEPDGFTVTRYEDPSLSIEFAEDLRREGLWGPCRTDWDSLEARLDRHARQAALAIATALEDFAPDLVVVENVFGLPLNPGYAEALAGLVGAEEIPALLRHHDLIWQRAEFDLGHLPPVLAQRIARTFPPRLKRAAHVVINEMSRKELEALGISATLVYNGFELPEPDEVPRSHARKARARQLLGMEEGWLLLVQPTRAIERKGLPDSVELGARLAERLGTDVRLLVCGPPEDGFQARLAELQRKGRSIADSGTGMRRGSFEMIVGEGRLPIDLAYQAADFVVFPSRWEGFGNPALESVAWARPLVVRRYPVLEELETTGLRFLHWDPDPVESVLWWLGLDEDCRLRILAENLRIASQKFSVVSLAKAIEKVLQRLGLPSELSPARSEVPAP